MLYLKIAKKNCGRICTRPQGKFDVFYSSGSTSIIGIEAIFFASLASFL